MVFRRAWTKGGKTTSCNRAFGVIRSASSSREMQYLCSHRIVPRLLLANDFSAPNGHCISSLTASCRARTKPFRYTTALCNFTLTSLVSSALALNSPHSSSFNKFLPPQKTLFSSRSILNVHCINRLEVKTDQPVMWLSHFQYFDAISQSQGNINDLHQLLA